MEGLRELGEAGIYPSGETIRIVLADDHAVVRSGLRMLLDSETGLEVVAEAGDLDSARRYVRAHNATVLVLDLNLSGESSLQAIPAIRAESPDTQIVVLTVQHEPAFARRALHHGALAYVLKEVADEQLAQAVRSAAAGEHYVPEDVRIHLAPDPPPEDPAHP